MGATQSAIHIFSHGGFCLVRYDFEYCLSFSALWWIKNWVTMHCEVIRYKSLLGASVYSASLSSIAPSRLWAYNAQYYHGLIHKYAAIYLWSRDNDILKCILLNKMHEFRLKFQWSVFLTVQLTLFQHWFRQWLGADQAQWWLLYWRMYASSSLS